MCKFRLLLDDVPVFHENLSEIRCSRVIGLGLGLVVTNGKITHVLNSKLCKFCFHENAVHPNCYFLS